MIDETTIQSVLKKITASKTFCDSEKYCTLLTYLVDKSRAGDVPKEYSIAIDFFKREKNFDPSEDTIVRYYMYRLRQKIKAYYEDEGKDDEIILEIPKGHYEVKFLPRPKTKRNSGRDIVSLKNILFLVIIILIGLSGYLLYRYNALANRARIINEAIDRNDPIWSDFFSNNLPTVLLIGDHLLYQEYDPQLQRFRFIIDHKITSNAEYQEFEAQYPNRKLIKSEQGSLPLNSIFNLNDLYNVFFSFNTHIDIKLSSVYMSSQFDLTNINGRNIIFIGGFRNLRKLNYIMDQISVSYEYAPDNYWRGRVIVPSSVPDSFYTFKATKFDDTHYSDLGFIAKVPGNKDENYLILTGFAYPAQIEVVRLVSTPLGLSKIYEQTQNKYKTFPPYFFMVIEVFGLEYSALESKVIYIKEISENSVSPKRTR